MFACAYVEHMAHGRKTMTLPDVPPAIVADVRKVPCRETASSALDNGVYKIWFARNYRALYPTPCCWTMRWPPWGRDCPRRWRPEWSTPTETVMAVCGDGGFMMNSQEMETAVRLGLHIIGALIARRCLRHDQMETGQHGIPELGTGLWQSRLREVRRKLWRQGLASRDD